MEDHRISDGTVELPTISLCDAVDSLEPHEPPIGGQGGSFHLSMHEDITEEPAAPQRSVSNSDPRPFKYVIKPTQSRICVRNKGVVHDHKGPIAGVKMITEDDEGGVSFRRYLIPRNKQARLLIWLQQLREGSMSHPFQFEPVPDGSPAQVLIQGNDLLIETDRELRGPCETYTNEHPFKYEHPGYRRPFRIAAWAIVDGAGNLILENNDPHGRPFRDSGDDKYTFYVSFHHFGRDT